MRGSTKILPRSPKFESVTRASMTLRAASRGLVGSSRGLSLLSTSSPISGTASQAACAGASHNIAMAVSSEPAGAPRTKRLSSSIFTFMTCLPCSPLERQSPEAEAHRNRHRFDVARFVSDAHAEVFDEVPIHAEADQRIGIEVARRHQDGADRRPARVGGHL